MTIKQDINKLTETKSNRALLNAQSQATSISKTRGVSSFSGSGDGQGSGISSPLTETSRQTVDVEVFDEFDVWSVTVRHVIQIAMTDSADRVVVFDFNDPTAP